MAIFDQLDLGKNKVLNQPDLGLRAAEVCVYLCVLHNTRAIIIKRFMLRKKTFIFLLPTILLFCSCNSISTVYRSSKSKSDYFLIRVATLSHCGCTFIYADNYEGGRLKSEILYIDNLARKTVYDYTQKNDRIIKTAYRAVDSSPTIQFDGRDINAFKGIDSVISNKIGIVYEIKRTTYAGFVIDTAYLRLLNSN